MFLAALLLASLVANTSADAFLKSRPEQVNKHDIKRLLFAELAGKTDGAKFKEVESFLRPLFVSLPKNAHGRLDAPLVRYSLHRYFVQKYGWHVKGLDSTWSNNDTSSPTTVLKSRAPAYIQSLFDEHLHGQGFGLHELAVFAATMADLIHAEATGQLESIHQVMGLPTNGILPRAEADEAVESFLVAYLLGGTSRRARSAEDLTNMRTKVHAQYPDYPETELWFQDFKATYDLTHSSRRNPFIEWSPTFDDSVSIVMDFSHQFGAFQNLECHSLKRKLTDMEFRGTGRVRMADFYSNALSGGWEFMESIQYLRNQGALDETDPSRPHVVIPNYMNSLTNCLTASNFYAICCVNECNALMSNLEMIIAQPQASPARIAHIVSGMQSDTVDAPRNLSTVLLQRLEDIATHHGGLVPLHGRLFAQWMHHAYPRECSFPHISGTVNPLTPEEFARKRGIKSLEATSEEMQTHAFWVNETSRMKGLPWAHVEEELAVHVHQPETRSRSGNYFSSFVGLVALASFGVPLYRTLRDAFAGSPTTKVESHMV